MTVKLVVDHVVVDGQKKVQLSVEDWEKILLILELHGNVDQVYLDEDGNEVKKY